MKDVATNVPMEKARITLDLTGYRNVTRSGEGIF